MDEKILKDHLRRWELEAQFQFHKAELFINSLDDVSKWMAEAPQWLNDVKQKTEGLPEDDPQRKELKMTILRNIAIVHARHKEYDPIGTRVYIAKIEADWENVRDNETINLNNMSIVSHKRICLYTIFSSEGESQENPPKLHDMALLKAFNHPQNVSN